MVVSEARLLLPPVDCCSCCCGDGGGDGGLKKELMSSRARFAEFRPSSSRCLDRRISSGMCRDEIFAPPRLSERRESESWGSRASTSDSSSMRWRDRSTIRFR